MGTDVTSIANLATQLAAVRNHQAVSLAVLKKALDIEKNCAEVLIQVLEAAGPSTSTLGSNINTYA